MRASRGIVVLLCLLAAACHTPPELNHRPLNSGPTREYQAPFEDVAKAVDDAMETLPVNLSDPVVVGSNRLVYFTRPGRQFNLGAVGRVVIYSIDSDTTRVTVAVEERYPLQFVRTREDDFAAMIFMRTEERLKPS